MNTKQKDYVKIALALVLIVIGIAWMGNDEKKTRIGIKKDIASSMNISYSSTAELDERVKYYEGGVGWYKYTIDGVNYTGWDEDTDQKIDSYISRFQD